MNKKIILIIGGAIMIAIIGLGYFQFTENIPEETEIFCEKIQEEDRVSIEEAKRIVQNYLDMAVYNEKLILNDKIDMWYSLDESPAAYVFYGETENGTEGYIVISALKIFRPNLCASSGSPYSAYESILEDSDYEEIRYLYFASPHCIPFLELTNNKAKKSYYMFAPHGTLSVDSISGKTMKNIEKEFCNFISKSNESDFGQESREIWENNILKNPEPIGKCGDGVCDEKEKANPKLCPEDCKTNDQLISCTDSDGGKDYYVAGETYGTIYAQGATVRNWEDFCSAEEVVAEYSCRVPTSENPSDVEIDYHRCIHGCLDGACIGIREQTCSTLGGDICSLSQACSGSWLSASDSERCCDCECEDSIINYYDSPFGVDLLSFNDYAYAKDLGIHFNRAGNYIIWKWSDVNKNGNYSFKAAAAPPYPGRPNSGHTINFDYERERYSDANEIAQIVNICPFRGGEYLKNEFKSEKEQEIYLEYVKKAVERYDGDSDLGCTQNAPDCYNPGDGEHPSQSFIEALQKNPIKYWQTCNQVTDTCIIDCKNNNNYATKYAKVQELTYLGVKASCPECQVLIGGDTGDMEMYPPIFEALNGKYIDIIDKHFYRELKNYQDIQIHMDFLKDSLQTSGFDLEKLRFWITEIGTYSGKPTGAWSYELPYQSESQQAQGLIRMYVTSFVQKIEKVFWAILVEGYGSCDCCIFDYVGLIYDGNKEQQACDTNDPYDLGKGIKKLAYYTYKLMTEKLEGSDWDNIQTIQESNNVYIYKFTKKDTGKPVWVAWWDDLDDNENSRIISIDIGDLNSVKITEAVPKYETGKEVTSYLSAFNTEIKTTDDERAVIVLGESPVFVERLE